MKFIFREAYDNKFIGQIEQPSDFLNVLKFFNEEKISLTMVTYKEHEDENLFEDYIVVDFYLTMLHDEAEALEYDASITVRLRKDDQGQYGKA